MEKAFIVPIALILFSLIFKFIFWIRVKESNRVNFFFSFLMFFSNNDWYDTQENKEKIFMKLNTLFNIILYLGLVIMVFSYMMDTEDMNNIIPTKREAYQNKIDEMNRAK